MTLLRAFVPDRSMLVAMAVAGFVFLIAGAAVPGHSTGFAQTPAADTTPEGSPANSNPQTVDAQGNKIGCSAIPEAQGGVLLGKIIPCLTHTIEKGAIRMSRDMIDFLRPTFYAFLSFILILFGIKVLQHEGQLQTEAFILLFKIGFCLTLLQWIPGTGDGNNSLIHTSYAIMAESQAVVMSTLDDSDSLKCPMDKFKGPNTPMIWAQMDCLMGELYGFTTGKPDASGNKRPNMLLASSVLGLLGGFFFGGSFGVALFFLCIGMLWSLFVLIIRVTVAFLNAHMFMALYMILSPLLLPLMFLRVTSQIYETWIRGIIASLLLPLVICAYVVLALQMYDALLFSPDALINKLFNYEWVKKAQDLPRNACDKQLLNNPQYRAQTTGMSEKDLYTGNGFLGPLMPGITGAGNNLCGGIKLPVFNLDANAKAGSKGATDFANAKEGFTKLFRDCVKLFLMAFLIDQGFRSLTGAIRPMLGSSSVVASLDSSTAQEQRLKSGMDAARRGFSRTLAGKSGTAFVGSMPEAFKKSLYDQETGLGFFNGIRRG